MRAPKIIAAMCMFVAMATMSMAQEPANKEVITIPKEQYQKLLDEHQKLLDEMKEMKAFKAQFEASQKKMVTQQAETDQSLDELDKQVKAAKQMAKDSFPGSSKMLLTGYGSASYIQQDHGGDK